MAQQPPTLTIEFPFASPPPMVGRTWQAWQECRAVLENHSLSRRDAMNVLYNLCEDATTNLPDRGSDLQPEDQLPGDGKFRGEF